MMSPSQLPNHTGVEQSSSSDGHLVRPPASYANVEYTGCGAYSDEDFEDSDVESRSKSHDRPGSAQTRDRYSPSNEAHAKPDDSVDTPRLLPPQISERIDVIIYAFSDDGCIHHRHHIESLEHVEEFWTNNWNKATGMSFLLLVEDVSDALIEVIDQYAEFRETTANGHMKGRVNDPEKRSSHVFPADKVDSTLFDRYNERKNLDSLTWWRLYSHSREGYVREAEALDDCNADTRKMTFPQFELQISDTHKGTPPDRTDLRDKISATLRREWDGVGKKIGNKKKGSKDSGPPNVLQYQVRRYRVQPHTYRPHQVITETRNDTWGTAAEERVTCHWFEDDSCTYCVVLFDKPRGIYEFTQTFQQSDNVQNNSIMPVLMSAPSSRLLPTFLSTESIDWTPKPSRRVSSNTKEVTNSRGVDQIASIDRSQRHRARPRPRQSVRNAHPAADSVTSRQKEKLPVSTRARFIELAIDECFLRQSKSKAQPRDVVFRRARLAFARMAAEDWNLVLSQMALTLDEIDSKMSDNTLLRRDALAWRRLLCSWRVSLVEYATSIEQVKSKLQFVWPNPSQVDRSIEAGTASTGSLESEETRDVCSNEEKSLLKLYHILLTGLHKIDKRVDRSFQAIMSSMSILESERAIVQGAAITRLTELAFFFIPLSFAATFFSMQIQEYDTRRPRMGHFFLMGVLLLVFLYSLRAVIRSTTLKKFKNTLENKIRDTSKVHGSEDIPTRVVASFLWGRLPALAQIGIVVLPPFLFTLLLIALVGRSKLFKGWGIAVLIIGTAVITVLLAMGEIVYAMRIAVILAWALSLLGAVMGGMTRPNPGVLGIVFASVTTICGVLWALISQYRGLLVWRRLVQLLLPVWIVILPFTILLHHYFRNDWEPYQIILGSMTFIIIFGLFRRLYDHNHRWLPTLLSMCALVCGIPLTLAWTVWPMGSFNFDKPPRLVHLRLDVRITISAFSGALFLVLAPTAVSKRYRRSKIWWYSTCFIVLLALPISLVWYILPTNGHQLPIVVKILVTVSAVLLCLIAASDRWYRNNRPRLHFLRIAVIIVAIPVTFVWALTPLPIIPNISLQAKISVTLGSVLVFSAIVRLLDMFCSEGWRLLSWFLGGLALMSWIPLFIWATDWKAFDPVRRKQSTAIHVTWGTTLPLLLIWLFLWKYAFSTRNTWIPMQRRKKKNRLVETSG